ncbi:HsdM family class I SAM-dependent methyltransferase [Tepidimonas charontis]|uniref:site-specific DNA-methyltransferase (adenine-specific) n=1 Tax=Tepidimonas charontis TaxID=2267262 RepID=A0A554WZD7_9BURK|nr:N-6 DNA methylase [Tepidimonas charontis]TSE28943.1 Modification methylase Eco57IB [Tepidimonas charontis]
MSVESVARYHSVVGLDHRRRHGQFFTPPPVARFMCRWLLKEGAREIFDPAFGLGAFYLAARELNPKIRFCAVEKDAKVLAHFREDHPNLDDTIVLSNADYFSVWGIKYSAIVCNPPYMRFQHFADRHRVIPEIEKHLGRRLSGYSNIASAFLLKSLHELAPGGRLAYLMPLEFLNTGYGETIKQALLDKGRLKALLRIEPEGEVFPDAITSVGIILVSDDGIHEPVKFCTVQTLDQLERNLSDFPCRSVLTEELRPADKWLRYFEEPCALERGALQPLSMYGSFSRGIATGANEYFLLSRSDAAKWELPTSILHPCISRSSQIKQMLITDDDIERLIEEGERVLLADLSSSQEEAVKKYIEFGERQRFDKRYLTRMRKPWFKLERRQPAPILFGVFSRNGFKVIRNKSRAVSLTCFHCFYPNIFGARFVDHLFLYFCSSVGQRIVAREVRKYGDKLNKFEPHDLNNALVPSPEWFARIPENVIIEKVACVSRVGAASCMRGLFDDLIG